MEFARMRKEAALHLFWASFGISAYEENTVPTGDSAPAFPYLTYSVATSDLGLETMISASLWYRSDTWTDINEKANDIALRIGRGGCVIHCDEGAIWLKKGLPFSQNMGDESDDLIKRKYINIIAEFLTAD